MGTCGRGTKDGLNRFDGYSCKIYKSDLFDNSSISDNHITCLYEDKDNNLWQEADWEGLICMIRVLIALSKLQIQGFEGKFHYHKFDFGES